MAGRRERPLDPEAGPVQRFAWQLRELRREAGGLTYRELSRSTSLPIAALSTAANGEVLPSLRVTLAYVAGCGGDRDEWERRWRVAAEQISGTDIADAGSAAGASPYLGLASYAESDSNRFFGRERLVADLIQEVERNRFLAVFGSSGSGKSSLLRAGLIPAVREGRVASGVGLGSVVAFVPGADPLSEMRGQLASLAVQSSDDPQAAASMADLSANIAGKPGQSELLLVVDQFEEVFTLCQDVEQRSRFIDALLKVRQPGSRARVVLGVRGDFFGRCGEHPELAAALRQASVLMSTMTADELRQVIVKPAVQEGLRVDPALTATVIQDAGTEPGALPLVSHALLETWRRRRGKHLSLAAYEAAGGVRGALAQTAERVYAGLPAGQQRLARSILIRLTALDEEEATHTRRRVRRADCAVGDQDEADLVLDRLARARLITLGEDSVEIAHEALIPAWPRLRSWLNDDREGLRVHQQLGQSAQQWQALGRDTSEVYRGVRLARARAWSAEHEGELTTLELAFLQAGTELEDAEHAASLRRTRQLRWLSVSLAVLLLLVTGAGAAAVGQRGQAVRAKQNAVSRQLAAQALSLTGSRPAAAKLLSMEAFRISPTTEARGSLLSMSADQSFQGEFNTGRPGNIMSAAAYTPDGRILGTTTRDKVIMLWDTVRRTQLATFTEHPTWLRALAFSPDGRVMASGGDDSSVVLWDVTRRTRSAALTGHKGPLNAIAFSPDGRTLASGGADRIVRLWDPDRHTQLATLPGHAGLIRDLAFSPDGRILATASDDHTVRLWDLRRRRLQATLTGHRSEVNSLAFSPDGRTVTSASTDRTASLWDVNRRTRLATFTGHAGPVRAVAFSPDGQTIASAGDDSTVLLWDVPRRARRATLTGHTEAIYSLTFSPRDGTLISAGADDTAFQWNLAQLPVSGHSDGINTVAFSPDGRTLATAGVDRGVVLWDSATRARRATFNAHRASVNALAFSPDSGLLATAAGEPLRTDHSIIIWDVNQRAAPITLNGHTELVTRVAFSPDGRTLASASLDKTVALWDVATHTRVATLTGHLQRVNGLAFSPDGKTLATAGRDGLLNLWDVATRTRRTTLTRQPGIFIAVAFSPDGRILATASRHREIALWDMATSHRLATLTGHTSLVNGVAFSPDGRILASASADHTVVLWNVDSRNRLATLSGHTASVNGVAFSPDGHTLASTSADRTTILWNTNLHDVQQQICRSTHRNLTSGEWTQFTPGLPYHRTCGNIAPSERPIALHMTEP